MTHKLNTACHITDIYRGRSPRCISTISNKGEDYRVVRWYPWYSSQVSMLAMLVHATYYRVAFTKIWVSSNIFSNSNDHTLSDNGISTAIRRDNDNQ
jgi:hypothetical protein